MVMELAKYSSYTECLDSLVSMGCDKAEILPMLEHERHHFEKAVELGYDAIYGVRLVPDSIPIITHFFVDFPGKFPEGQDMIDILLAPDEPGPEDLERAEKIRAEMNKQHPFPA